MSFTSRSQSTSPSPQSLQDTSYLVLEKSSHESSGERKHQEICERLTLLLKKFQSSRSCIFKELKSNLELELRQVFEEIERDENFCSLFWCYLGSVRLTPSLGVFEEYTEQIEDLENLCEEKILAAQLHRDHHFQQLEKEYEAELERAQKEYLKEKESLKERMILQIEEKKKKLREDKDQLEINNDIAIEASARVHTTKKHRKKDPHHHDGRPSKRRHMTADVMILQLKEQDISQDVAIIQKGSAEHGDGVANINTTSNQHNNGTGNSNGNGGTHRKSTTSKHRR